MRDIARACCVKYHAGSSAAASNESTNSHYAPDTLINPTHMLLSLDFTQLSSAKISGSNTITFTASHTPSNIVKVLLDAVSLQITAVAGARYSHDGKILILLWDTPFAPLEKRDVCISYLAINPVAGLYFNIPNSTHPKRSTHCITDNEPERCRYWIPCIDAPTVRTTLEFHLLHLSSHSAFANGRELSKTSHANNTCTTVWSLTEAPCPSYLICVAVGDLLVVPDGNVDGIPVTYICPQNNFTAENLKLTFGKTKSMISWISNKVGHNFPWKKYFQIASPQIRGAMENISLVTWNDLYVCDDILSTEKQMLVDQVIIHEMAHTYFGDLLVVRHFDHTWLKESWATYFEALWIQEHMGMDTYRYEMLDEKKLYISEVQLCGRYTRPIVKRNWDSPWAMFDCHAYPGGAWRIHMLRWKLGEDIFWTGVRDYVKAFSGKVVETHDFRRCLEIASGINLVKFFDQWIYGRGFPKLKVTYTHILEDGMVQIKAEQTQSAGDSLFTKLFEIDLEVELTDSTGKVYNSTLEFCDSPIAVANFNFSSKTSTPRTLRLDPHGKVLFTHEFTSPLPLPLLISNVTEGSDIFTRIWSYEELVKQGLGPGMRAVSENIVKEQFWGVRGRVASALAKGKTQECVNIVARMLDTEKDPMALVPITQACKTRDPTIRTALLAFLGRSGEQPYRATANALENLGLQTNPADLPFLLSYASNPKKIGMHAILRGGVLEGLGNHGSIESYSCLELRTRVSFFPSLVTAKEYAATDMTPEPEKSFPSLICGLACAVQARSCKSTRTHVVSLLADLLRDARGVVRKEAIWALCDLGAVDTFAAIQATRPTFPDQDWMFIERRVRSVREEAGDGKVRELVRSLEDVEGRLRKMEYVSIEEAEKKKGAEGTVESAGERVARISLDQLNKEEGEEEVENDERC